MYSVDTGFIYAIYKLQSSNQYKIACSVLIFYDRGAKMRSCTCTATNNCECAIV